MTTRVPSADAIRFVAIQPSRVHTTVSVLARSRSRSCVWFAGSTVRTLRRVVMADLRGEPGAPIAPVTYSDVGGWRNGSVSVGESAPATEVQPARRPRWVAIASLRRWRRVSKWLRAAKRKTPFFGVVLPHEQQQIATHV